MTQLEHLEAKVWNNAYQSKVTVAKEISIWLAQATKAIFTLYTVGLLLSVTGAVAFFGSQMTRAMTTGKISKIFSKNFGSKFHIFKIFKPSFSGFKQFLTNPVEALESLSAPVSLCSSKRNSEVDLRSRRRTSSVRF